MKFYAKLILTLSSCFLLFYIYYHRETTLYWKEHNFKIHETVYPKLVSRLNYGNEEFLINTSGCSIPNYGNYLRFTSTQHIDGTCGERAIFIKHVGNDKVLFQIDKKKLQKYVTKKWKVECCYKFGSTVPGTDNFVYTKCTPFQHGKKIKLLQQVVTVTCVARINKKSTDIVYEDSYIMVKMINKKKNKMNKSWNILVLGMSTMSRARVFDTMPRTVQYLQKNKWLDYKGYHTVGHNVLSITSMLTGKNMTTLHQNCALKSQRCNELFIWRNFKEAGYITAFGNDYLELTDAFSKNAFEPPSTDHQVWPYFHMKYRRRKGNFFCTKNVPTGIHLLDYAYQFVDTYKTNNFFGMFWINTFSNRIETTPSLIDADITDFFENINKTGVLKRTFIMLLSDHGIRSGDIKTQRESYYEERLPMFFMWVPYEFRKQYPKEYNNTQINQNRLTSAHDLYSTAMDILNISDYKTIRNLEACPQCSSLFVEKSLQRRCLDAGVDNKWCACHNIEVIDGNEIRVMKSIKLIASYIQNKSKTTKTVPCMTCVDLNTKSVIRTHSYSDNHKIYYLIAIQMSPGRIMFEATVIDDGKELRIVLPIVSISRYGRGNCAIDPKDRMFCSCDITVCNQTVVLLKYKKNKQLTP